MCGPEDKSAKIARKQARENQRRIDAARAQVDGVFSQFDDKFFQQREQEAADFFVPEVDRQFGRAHESSVKKLAGRGALDSSAGARVLGDLQRQFQIERSNAASRAVSVGQQARADVDRARGGIYDQVQAGLTPNDAAARARSSAAQFESQADFSPVGDLFAGALSQFGQAAILQQEGFHGTGIEALNPKRSRSTRVIN